MRVKYSGRGKVDERGYARYKLRGWSEIPRACQRDSNTLKVYRTAVKSAAQTLNGPKTWQLYTDTLRRVCRSIGKFLCVYALHTPAVCIM